MSGVEHEGLGEEHEGLREGHESVVREGHEGGGGGGMRAGEGCEKEKKVLSCIFVYKL